MYASSPFELFKTPGNLLKKEAPDVAHEQAYTENFRDVKNSNAIYASSCTLKKERENSCKHWGICDVNGQGGEGYHCSHNTWESSPVDTLCCKFHAQISILPSEKTVQSLELGEAECKYLGKEPALNSSFSKEVLSNAFLLDVINCKSSEGVHTDSSEEIQSNTSELNQSGSSENVEKETELLQNDQLQLKKEAQDSCKNWGTCDANVHGGEAYHSNHNTWQCSPVDALCCKFHAQISILPREKTVQSLELDEVDCPYLEKEPGEDVLSNVFSSDFINCKSAAEGVHSDSSENQSDTSDGDQSGSSGNVTVTKESIVEKETELIQSDQLQLNNSPKELKSVIRGAYEKLGLGPRPKLHVTWAPDVCDPPCTSTSHTATRNHQRHFKGDHRSHKTSRKGKGSRHSDSHSHKKYHKKTVRRTKYILENDIFRSTTVPKHEWGHAPFEGPALNWHAHKPEVCL